MWPITRTPFYLKYIYLIFLNNNNNNDNTLFQTIVHMDNKKINKIQC